MIFLQDHIFSIIIAGILLLALAQLFQEARESGVETTSQYSGNIHSLEFIKVIQQDFQNIGAGLADTSAMIIDYQWDNAAKFFVFRGDVTPADTSNAIEQIRYSLVPTDTIMTIVNDSLQSIGAFEVQREVLDGGTYEFAGASVATIRDFEITLRNDLGTALTANWDSTRQIDVRMITVPPLATDKAQFHKEWQTTFRPLSLTMKN